MNILPQYQGGQPFQNFSQSINNFAPQNQTQSFMYMNPLDNQHFNPLPIIQNEYANQQPMISSLYQHHHLNRGGLGRSQQIQQMQQPAVFANSYNNSANNIKYNFENVLANPRIQQSAADSSSYLSQNLIFQKQQKLMSIEQNQQLFQSKVLGQENSVSTFTKFANLDSSKDRKQSTQIENRDFLKQRVAGNKADGEVLINYMQSLSHDQNITVIDIDKRIYKYDDEDDDVSNESVAERKIMKIDRRLKKNRTYIDKTSKRRLQNRKSALKCRLRKSHLIATLQNEIQVIKADRQALNQEVGNLKCQILQVAQLQNIVKEEKNNNSALKLQILNLQSTQSGCSNMSTQNQVNSLAFSAGSQNLKSAQSFFPQNNVSNDHSPSNNNSGSNLNLMVSGMSSANTQISDNLSGLIVQQSSTAAANKYSSVQLGTSQFTNIQGSYLPIQYSNLRQGGGSLSIINCSQSSGNTGQQSLNSLIQPAFRFSNNQ